MLFVVVGTLLVILKLLEIGAVATLAWWWVLAPFACAVLWWAWADATGLTQRRAIRHMQERQARRRERDVLALGLDPHKERRKHKLRETVERNRAARDGNKPRR
jgi:small Trp-rich protein